MKKPPPPEEKGERAPLWIISFADMISLLMAFFVMLLTMATPQSGELGNTNTDIFDETIGSFNATISNYGIPWFIDKKEKSTPNDDCQDNPPVGNSKYPPVSVMDECQSEARLLFVAIEKQAKTFRSQTEGLSADFVVVPVMFEKGQTVLNEQGRAFLTNFSAELSGAGTNKELMMYVIGLAWEEKDETQQWIISVKRAQAVADFLNNTFSLQSRCTIYSWGAGNGGSWVVEGNPMYKQSQILIAVLKATN